MECPVRKVTLAHVELRGLKEQRVPQDHKVQLGQKVQPGQRAPVAPASKCSQQLLQTQLHIAELANGRSGSWTGQKAMYTEKVHAAL